MLRQKISFLIGLVAFLWFLSHPSWAAAETPMAKTWNELERLFPNSKDCAKCHQAHYQQWEKSYHALSLVTSLSGMKGYIASEQKKKGRFPNKEELSGCFTCHLPTLRYASEEMNKQVARLVLDGKKDELEKLAELKVGCAFCHSAAVNPKIEPNVYYGPIQDPQPAIGGHQSRYAQVMSSSEFCRSCHSFLKTADRDIWCTLTYEAWVEGLSSKQGVQCQYCHMKSRDDRAAESEGMPVRVVHSHDFPGGHHPSILQDAVRLILSVDQAKDTLLLQVTMHNLAGHRLPDTWPWLAQAVLDVTARDEKGEQIFNGQRSYESFGYDAAGERSGSVVTIVKADFSHTLPTGESTARFEIPTPKGAELIVIEASMVYKISPDAAPVPMATVTRNVALK